MTTVTAQQTAADLLSAAGYIETYGLEKGDYGEMGAPACMGGAIKIVLFGDTFGVACPGEKVKREFAARGALLSILPDVTIGYWNDQPERTQAEASAKLREAAEAVFPSV